MRITVFTSISVLSILLCSCGGGGGGGNEDGGTNNSDVKLSWTIPSTRLDGSFLALSELSGYRIYYGESVDDRNLLIDIEDNSITDYTVSRGESTPLYYTVTAYDTLGVESNHSNAELK